MHAIGDIIQRETLLYAGCLQALTGTDTGLARLMLMFFFCCAHATESASIQGIPGSQESLFPGAVPVPLYLPVHPARG